MATILVVDDEPDIRQLVQLNLELDGHRVLTAGNGQEALTVLEGEIPDVMLLDLNMPELDGWAVLQRIKDAGDTDVSQIPVLMLTAYDTPDSRVRGGIEGALRYLTKPFSPTALRDEIREALEGDPEPVKRRKAQQAALEQLARMEKGADPAGGSPFVTRPHITRLEHRPSPSPEPKQLTDARGKLQELTDKQRDLLERLSTASSVSDAATELGVSRSNVYASLRRISRKLGVASVPDLLVLVRDGSLLGDA
ncbi:MAG TPA: response regulator [Acidimicrobiales bacterium]|nr:response regulator [Acidimicrobiales bacterium]